jgi:hypothetical protein
MSCQDRDSGNRSTGRRAVEFANRVRGSTTIDSTTRQYEIDRPSSTDSHRRIQAYENRSNRQDKRRRMNRIRERAGDTTTVEFPVIVVQEATGMLSRPRWAGTPRAKSE